MITFGQALKHDVATSKYEPIIVTAENLPGLAEKLNMKKNDIVISGGGTTKNDNAIDGIEAAATVWQTLRTAEFRGTLECGLPHSFTGIVKGVSGETLEIRLWNYTTMTVIAYQLVAANGLKQMFGVQSTSWPVNPCVIEIQARISTAHKPGRVFEARIKY